MSQLFIPADDIIDYFGIDVFVYVLPKPEYVGGVYKKPKLEDITPEKRHDVFVPNDDAYIAQFLTGGAAIIGDFLWLSTSEYPANETIVRVPAQNNRYFRALNSTPWNGYSDLVVYGCKGDDRSPDAI